MTDIELIYAYIRTLLEAGINVPDEVVAAMERIRIGLIK